MKLIVSDLPADLEGKGFNPGDHPRDMHGRFIRKGVSVNLTNVPGKKKGAYGAGHNVGKVVGTRSRGRIEVEDNRGNIHVVKASDVEVSKTPSISKRSGVPMRRTESNRRKLESDRRSGHSSEESDIDENDHIHNDVETERKYLQHTKNIEKIVGEKIKAGQTTDKIFTLDDDNRVWEPDRAKLHKQIVEEMYLRADKVPTEGKSIIAGGLGGAGKSTVLGKSMGIGRNDYFTINPDDVKETMADLDMIPDIQGLSPMEASALVHEESSHIANLLAQKAYADKRNVIWDITMSSQKSVDKRLSEMRDRGYKEINAVFVDIPVETSVQRALERHRRGMEAFDAGESGFGGRYVPPALIRANASSKASSANREVFDSLRNRFDNWSLFDNSGTAPKKIGDQSSSKEVKFLLELLQESSGELRRLLTPASFD